MLPRYDVLDPAWGDDLYPLYKTLRDAAPLVRGGPARWVATRYADVARLLRDPRLGHQFPAGYHEAALGDGAAASFFRRIVLYRDPPDHDRLRGLVRGAFSASLVRALEVRIGELVRDLLEPALERGYLDAVEDLALPLPVMVICDMLGIPAVDLDAIRPRAADLARAFGTHVLEADRAAANAAVVWLRSYVDVLASVRERVPGTDLLSHMLAATGEGGRLSRAEVVDNVVFLFFAGFETSFHVLATGCAALARLPDQLARLRAEPALVPRAVEEFLRFDAPVQGVARLVNEPVEIGERTVRAGRVLVLLLGSANHDERQFTEPERLDVTRHPNQHVSFGGGIHHCLGAALARLEATVTFTALVDLTRSFEAAGEQTRGSKLGFHSFVSVPVALARR